MNLKDTMQELESHRFAAEVNVVSGSEAFYRGLRNHRLFRELLEHAKDVGGREAIARRSLELSRRQIDVRYENPFDTAMAAYLTALDQRPNLDMLATVAAAVSNAPNCWWAVDAATTLISKVKMQKLAVSLGKIDPLIHVPIPQLGRIAANDAASPVAPKPIEACNAPWQNAA